jgi:predicted RNA-binding protein with PUA-like domain
MKAHENWLMKSEPDAFSIDDLKKAGTEPWTGVRNYQARNFMRQMQPGDRVFFYHSSTAVPASPAWHGGERALPRPDPVQPQVALLRPEGDARAAALGHGRRALRAQVRNVLALSTLKANEDRLEGLGVLQRGSRLSVLPVTTAQARELLKMAEENDGK